MKDFFKFLIYLFVLTVLVFSIHLLWQWVFPEQNLSEVSSYTLPQIYLVQVVLSIIVLFGLLLVKQVAIGFLGFSFLALLALKLVVSYLFISPALAENSQNNLVKYTFLFVLFVFMFYDMFIGIKVLNQQQRKIA